MNDEIISNKVMSVLLSTMNDDKSFTLRELARQASLTEREVELSIQILLSKSFINPITDLIGPESIIALTETGKQQEVIPEPVKLEKHEIMATHSWQKIQASRGSPGSAEALLGTKHYPMGGWCVRCGITSMECDALPIVCPKKVN